MPSDEAEFSKRPPSHRQKQKPQSFNVWRQIFQKRGKQKTLRKGHISGKKGDNFELRTKIVPREPRPKLSRVAESLPRLQCVIHPWRIYPSYGHWDDHFDDGYIRQMALNGLKERICPWLAQVEFYAKGPNLQLQIYLSSVRKPFFRIDNQFSDWQLRFSACEEERICQFAW